MVFLKAVHLNPILDRGCHRYTSVFWGIAKSVMDENRYPKCKEKGLRTLYLGLHWH